MRVCVWGGQLKYIFTISLETITHTIQYLDKYSQLYAPHILLKIFRSKISMIYSLVFMGSVVFIYSSIVTFFSVCECCAGNIKSVSAKIPFVWI